MLVRFLLVGFMSVGMTALVPPALSQAQLPDAGALLSETRIPPDVGAIVGSAGVQPPATTLMPAGATSEALAGEETGGLSPGIFGWPFHNQTIIVTYNGDWNPPGWGFGYQWTRCVGATNTCTDIPGATGNSYITRKADQGGYLRVRVTTGDGRWRVSNHLGPIMNFYAGLSPGIVGWPFTSQTLTTIYDGDWSPPSDSFTYQWTRCEGASNDCSDIAGATGRTYLTTSADRGTYIRLRVTADDGRSNVSAHLGPIFELDPDPTTQDVQENPTAEPGLPSTPADDAVGDTTGIEPDTDADAAVAPDAEIGDGGIVVPFTHRSVGCAVSFRRRAFLDADRAGRDHWIYDWGGRVTCRNAATLALMPIQMSGQAFLVTPRGTVVDFGSGFNAPLAIAYSGSKFRDSDPRAYKVLFYFNLTGPGPWEKAPTGGFDVAQRDCDGLGTTHIRCVFTSRVFRP